MVSVCMATKNGGMFIREQLDSILPQLGEEDEIVISDDFSSDDTVDIIKSFKDHRIRILESQVARGISSNFEASLTLSAGDYIFLADQDDVWLPGKVNKMLEALSHYDLVMSDCRLVDDSLQVTKSSFYNLNNSGSGLLKNLFKNSYMGCCMAFTKRLKDRALPFPYDIPIHDFWIGLIGEVYYKVHFMKDTLVLHRRHDTNASTSGEISDQSWQEKFGNRLNLVKNLFIHKFYAG
ncbi:MAG: glycosyltransferase family 2 protein [Cyclobacteriaceae bacterium]